MPSAGAEGALKQDARPPHRVYAVAFGHLLLIAENCRDLRPPREFDIQPQTATHIGGCTVKVDSVPPGSSHPCGFKSRRASTYYSY